MDLSNYQKTALNGTFFKTPFIQGVLKMLKVDSIKCVINSFVNKIICTSKKQINMKLILFIS